jgi:AraC-like DNA-binding protein
MKEEKTERRTDIGIIRSTTWTFDDIKMGHAISSAEVGNVFSTSQQNSDVVRLHFGLKGDYAFTYKQLNKTYDLIGGHHNIMFSKDFDIVVQNKTADIETFGIQFPRAVFVNFTQNATDALKRFADAIMNEESIILSENWGSIDSPIQQVIQQVINCKYSGDLKKLFMLSKCIELLVLCAESYDLANKKDPFIKNKADKEKIIAVRDLINERVTDPPNLSQISKLVGLNEYKLKRGFKETFNNTVFGYLAEQRLHLAHQYLRDTKKTAAEISYELGYATPQHFNNAFKKKFGLTPFTVRNNP